MSVYFCLCRTKGPADREYERSPDVSFWFSPGVRLWARLGLLLLLRMRVLRFPRAKE